MHLWEEKEEQQHANKILGLGVTMQFILWGM